MSTITETCDIYSVDPNLLGYLIKDPKPTNHSSRLRVLEDNRLRQFINGIKHWESNTTGVTTYVEFRQELQEWDPAVAQDSHAKTTRTKSELDWFLKERLGFAVFPLPWSAKSDFVHSKEDIAKLLDLPVDSNVVGLLWATEKKQRESVVLVDHFSNETHSLERNPTLTNLMGSYKGLIEDVFPYGLNVLRRSNFTQNFGSTGVAGAVLQKIPGKERIGRVLQDFYNSAKDSMRIGNDYGFTPHDEMSLAEKMTFARFWMLEAKLTLDSLYKSLGAQKVRLEHQESLEPTLVASY